MSKCFEFQFILAFCYCPTSEDRNFFIRKHLRMIVVLFRNDIRICKVFGNEIDEYLESFSYPEAKKDKS